MPIATQLTRLLGISHPIVSAPMDLVAGAKLTAAVSQAGGFGILGGGYGDRQWLETELSALKSDLSSDEPFGVGFITWSLSRKPELLDLALDASPAAIMLSFGDPKPFASTIKSRSTCLICQVQDEDMAQQALDAGADVLVAQGTEAGGHGASRTLIDVVTSVSDLVEGRVPVVAAGGIADGRGLAAAMMLGAAGVLLGTRFYASNEAEGHPTAKRRICEASGEDTVRGIIFDISRNNVWPSPFTGRCLQNAHARKWRGRELEMLQDVERISADYDRALEAGDFDVAAVIAGQAVGLIEDVLPARVIIDRMVDQADRLLKGHSNVIAGSAT
jgi:nitronate monooxygenase